MWFLRETSKAVAPQPGPWDTAASVQVEHLASLSGTRELRSHLIDTYLASRSVSSGIFVGSRIKEKIESNVRRAMDIPNSDAIKVIFDGTLIGSATNGLALSVDGLYWKEFLGSPQFVKWEAISMAQSNKRLSFNRLGLVIDNASIAIRFRFYSPEDVREIITGILSVFHSHGR